MDIKYIALDCGKANTKIAVRDNNSGDIITSIMKTKVTKVDNNVVIDNSSKGSIEYNGQRYAIEMVNAKADLNNNKKLDETHTTMALYAIASNVNNGDRVKVAINCPLSDGNSKENLKKFRDNILPKGEITVVINNVPKTFDILSVVPIPEGIAATGYIDCPITGKDKGVIDIGGLNATYTYYNKENLMVDDKSKLTRDGFLKFCDMNLASINQELNEQNDFDTIVDLMAADPDPLFDDLRRKLVGNVINAASNMGWNLKRCTLIFVGGAVHILEPYIKEFYPDAIIPANPEYCNVLGAMKTLCAMNALTFKC